ncbi:amidinotransferase [Streptomyces sp. NBC_00885]|uniref:dimethylargininase n=1 Tax=Streptomyces sp. NBC_00885 TaxID=2975857 RepID=UPI003870069C|nr:amidinotransferase [Streptomyces sp. NBC_00885]
MPPTRTAEQRRYLVCPPEHFDVRYAINPWMTSLEPVDIPLAHKQWDSLVSLYRELGHTVETVEPVADLPDMVFAANSALVLDGRAFGAKFHAPQRQPEAGHYLTWFEGAGFETLVPSHTCEGEGDFTPVGGFILAGTGFRTLPAAHHEAQEFFGTPTVSLHLVDPHFYHLDTALFALDDSNIAYYPGAFSNGSRQVLNKLFPDAVIATRQDALAFGLNSISDGRHVVMAQDATGLMESVAAHGYEPIPVDLSEFRKAGGGAKCCTQELRG